MSASIADLGMRVDSSQVVAGTDALNKLTPAAEKAEGATKKLAAAHGGLSSQGQSAFHAIRSMTEQVALGVSPTQALVAQMNHLSYAASGTGGLKSAMGEAAGAIKSMVSGIVSSIGPYGLAAAAIGTVTGLMAALTQSRNEEFHAISSQIDGYADFDKGIEKLSEQYHFLNAATRSYLTSLEDSGQHSAAVVAAMGEINKAIDEQKAHLVGLEGLWRDVQGIFSWIGGEKTLVKVRWSPDELRGIANKQLDTLSGWADDRSKSGEAGSVQSLLSAYGNYKRLADSHFAKTGDNGQLVPVMTNEQASRAVDDWKRVAGAIDSLRDPMGALLVNGQRYMSQQQIEQRIMQDSLALGDAKTIAEKGQLNRDMERLRLAGKEISAGDRQNDITLAGTKAEDAARRELDKHNLSLEKHNALLEKAAFRKELHGLRGVAGLAFREGRNAALMPAQEDLDVIKDINGPLEAFVKRMEALDRLRRNNKLSGAAAGAFASKTELEYLQSLSPHDFGGGFSNQARIMQIGSGNQFGKLGKQVADIFGPDGTLITGISDATAKALIFGDSFSGAIKNIGASIASDLLSQLIKIGLTQLENAVLGDSLAAATMAQTTAMAAATGAAWATPAALASLASFGGNAAPAIAGLEGTVAVSQAIAAISTAMPGFANGVVGLSGAGSALSDSIMARLSAGESVVTATGTLGNQATLKAMNRGAKFDGAGPSPTVHIVVEQHAGVAVDFQTDHDGRMRIIARQELLAHAPHVVAASQRDPNGVMSKALRDTIKAARSRR